MIPPSWCLRYPLLSSLSGHASCNTPRWPLLGKTGGRTSPIQSLGLSSTYMIVLTLFFRHAGHCWRSRDELIRDLLLWTPTHGRAKAGRPARTYIQLLCEDTGCCPEDLPRAMNDREEWRERVRDIRATSAIWWWWWFYLIGARRQLLRVNCVEIALLETI